MLVNALLENNHGGNDVSHVGAIKMSHLLSKLNGGKKRFCVDSACTSWVDMSWKKAVCTLLAWLQCQHLRHIYNYYSHIYIYACI